MKCLISIIEECSTVSEINLAMNLIDKLCSDRELKQGLMRLCLKSHNRIKADILTNIKTEPLYTDGLDG